MSGNPYANAGQRFIANIHKHGHQARDSESQRLEARRREIAFAWIRANIPMETYGEDRYGSWSHVALTQVGAGGFHYKIAGQIIPTFVPWRLCPDGVSVMEDEDKPADVSKAAKVLTKAMKAKVSK